MQSLPLHSSSAPSSTTPSPQRACVQSLRQASGTVSLLSSPSSHSSSPSTSPLPQLWLTLFWLSLPLSLFWPPSSSPQAARARAHTIPAATASVFVHPEVMALFLPSRSGLGPF